MPETKIEWADDSENAASGCSEAVLPSGKMDPACVNCYARLMSARLAAMGQPLYEGVATRTGDAARWSDVFRWDAAMLTRKFNRMKGGHRVFLGSMTDLWHDQHDPALLVALAEEIRRLGRRPPEKRPHLITLTKRADRLLAWQREHFPDGLPSYVWPGVTAGCQEAADLRIPVLLQVRAEGPRVVSVEPMTGPVSLFAPDATDPGLLTGPGVVERGGQDHLTGEWSGWSEVEIGWVICGGESGQKARPTHPGWARDLRDQCVAAGVPFHFKQWGEWWPMDADWPVQGDDRALLPSGEVSTVADVVWHPSMAALRRVGKHNAGRILDGRTWDEVPTTGANP